MNYTYNANHHQKQPLETNNYVTHAYSKTACSLQTDPDLYALRNKTKQNLSNIIKKQQQQQRQQQQQQHQQQQLVSTSNRLAYVEALVDINAVVIESIWYSTQLSATTATSTKESTSRVSPVVPLRTFIQEVLKRSRTTYSTLQTALFYLFRARPTILDYLQQQNNSKWQHNAYISCGRRMFLASLVVASKFVQDKTYRNSAWAKIAGLPVAEINTAERYFLDMMDYRLYIDQVAFDRWHRLLHVRTQARMRHIPTTLRDLSFLSFAPSFKEEYPSPPLQELYYTPNHHHHQHHHPVTPISPSHYHHHHHYACTQCSPKVLPPTLSLSLPSSISSSPAQTPTEISPIRTTSKRKYDELSSREQIAILDKKHCRFWQ